MTVMHPVPPPAPDAVLVGRQSLAEYLQRLSEDEFYAFCQQNRDQKFERRADGTIELLPLSGGLKGIQNVHLLTALGIWAEAADTGIVFASSTSFRLPNGAVRTPAASWVASSRWAQLSATQKQKFPPLCPDFAVELLSETDSISDLVIKMQEYITNGCRLAWLIDPKSETARVFRADGSVSVVKSFADTLSGEEVLPGFAFPLSTLR